MKKKYLCPLEWQEQIAVMEWAITQPVLRDYLIAIPNGGTRFLLEAKKLKRCGVRKGVSDFFLPWPKIFINGELKVGLWIELKRENKKISKLTKDQIIWINKMRALDYCAEVAYGAVEAIELFKKYLKGDLE